MNDDLLKRLAFVVTDLDRAGIVRADAARVAELRRSDRARFLPVWKQRQPFEIDADGAARPIILTAADAAHESVFLGLVDDTPWFAVALPDEVEPAGADLRMLLELVARLPAEQASVLAYARAMVIWHANHKHCGRCGAATTVTQAGHSRTCTACDNVSFPRTDPVVIVVIVHPDGEQILLGRQASWPIGFFSCIAGFVEPSETLEAAVAREAMEETGVQVTDVRYMASQPWPFPSSLMLGFSARAVTTEIRLNDNELAEARWFSRDVVRGAAERGKTDEGLTLTFPFAIARYLIDSWAAEK